MLAYKPIALLTLMLWPNPSRAGELDLPAEQGTSGCNLSILGGQSRRTFDTFDQALRKAVKGNRAQDLVPLLAFPLRVNRDGGVIHIRNEQEFLKEAPRAFTKSVREAITGAAGFFCNSGGLSYGGGTVWVSTFQKADQEHYGIFAINVPEVDPAAADHPTPKVECVTPKHRIVIDSPKGELRYRSWNRSKASHEKPDLELHHGKSSAAGTGACSHWIYSFANGNTHYVFTEPGCTEVSPPPGSRGELEVKQKDKVLANWWCVGV